MVLRSSKVIDSKALRVNLEATQVEEIEFNQRYMVLLDAVQDYKGISDAAGQLLRELHHPFRNWDVIIGELRAFSLKNLQVYSRSHLAKEAIEMMFELHLGLIHDAPKVTQKVEATDALLAFLEKTIQSLKKELIIALVPCMERIFQALLLENPILFRFMAKSHHPLTRSLKLFLSKVEQELIPPSFIRISVKLIGEIRKKNYEQWLDSEDPLKWLKATLNTYKIQLTRDELKEIKAFLRPLSHKTIRQTLKRIEKLERTRGIDLKTLKELLEIPGNFDIVRQYREIARKIRPKEELLLLFLFHIMELPGLSVIHEETIRNINRLLINYIKNADIKQLRQMLPRELTLLKQKTKKFPQTALQCIEALGIQVLKLDNPQITELFINKIIDFGFQTPNVEGVDIEWHVLRNPAHLQNIRVWMNLIAQRPYQCSSLLSALLINIKLGGICLKDTDLFQKDVSRFLNSDIRPVYNLVKQLAKQFPVYFNEIGAEGILRDISTELDEITRRQDRLIHFLRKQSHVESNNLIVNFIEAILCFWYSREKEGLRPYLPSELLDELPVSGPFVDPVHRLLVFLSKELGLEPFSKQVSRLANVQEGVLERLLMRAPDVPPRDRERFLLLIKMYRLEILKYQLSPQEILHHLEDAKNYGFEGLDEVITAVKRNVPEECLGVILNQLKALQEIILSPERFEGREDIYMKRHIAADIPSMYGKYHERKFDALSLTFRLENLANTYFEKIIQGFDLKFVTRTKLEEVIQHLKLLWQAVRVDGIQSKKFETYLKLMEQALEFRQFSFGQFRDIVQGLLEGVKDIIYIYYIHPHQDNLSKIILQLYPNRMVEKFKKPAQRATSANERIHHISEIFLRDLIAGTFGLQYLDLFISRVHQVFEEQYHALTEKNLDLLLTYNPENSVCPIHTPNPATKNIICLGNKGFNLILLSESHIPVPPGVILTTEIYRCKEIFSEFPRVLQELKGRLRDSLNAIEDRVKRRFGHPAAPLLLSVRSGAAISMPGMMSTIINVGSNIETIEGLAKKTGNPWFAWDNYRRFVQSWAMAFGLGREVFTKLMVEFKRECNVEKKRQFTGDEMRTLALRYRDVTLEKGIKIIDDPWEQLMCTIRLVLNSWESEKAKAYREIMGLSDRWGTAVIIQAMTFGNLSEQSGTGVVFTTNPNHKMERVCLWGDYTPGNQGEDIVSGLVSTYPISKEQKEYLNVDDPCLEEAFPEIYERLFEYAKRLIVKGGWSHQEMEFTFESPDPKDLYLLQTRDMTTKKKRSYPVFPKTRSLKNSFLGRGIGVSGGALSGRVAFTLDDIESLMKRYPKDPVILIRSDTVPDDIKEISRAQGLLTAKGGQTSHAAIVALRLEKTCVVGFKGLSLYENQKKAVVQGKSFVPGDFISIDGRNGSVYAGRHRPTT